MLCWKDRGRGIKFSQTQPAMLLWNQWPPICTIPSCRFTLSQPNECILLRAVGISQHVCFLICWSVWKVHVSLMLKLMLYYWVHDLKLNFFDKNHSEKLRGPKQKEWRTGDANYPDLISVHFIHILRFHTIWHGCIIIIALKILTLTMNNKQTLPENSNCL